MAKGKTRIPFSKTAIEKLEIPNAGRVEYYDIKVPGLVLRVSSTGVKSFSWFRRLKNDGVLRETIGRFGPVSYDDAARVAHRFNGILAQGIDPGDVRRKLKKEPTFSQIFEEFEKRHGRFKKSWKDDEQRFRHYLEPALGRKKLSSIQQEQIATVLSNMDAAGKAGATVNAVRALASVIFNKAIEWGYLKDNPVKAIKARKTRQRDRFLQPNELGRFFDALAEEKNPVMRDFFLMALLTGARRENILTMRWEHLDLKSKIWRLPSTKNDTPHIVNLTDEAVVVLLDRAKARWENNPYVFPGRGATGHLVEPKTGWKRMLERSGLTDINIHDLRRTLGSWQANNNSSLHIIGRSLNHKSVQTTTIYARLMQDPVRESVNRGVGSMLKAAGVPRVKISVEEVVAAQKQVDAPKSAFRFK